jgi:hypothetical protein
MRQFVGHLAIVIISSVFVSAIDDTIGTQIDELASVRGFDITGLPTSENLLACLEAYNCRPRRLGDSEWQTELVGNIPDVSHDAIEKRQCVSNSHGVTNTILTIGSSNVDYGDQIPYNIIQAVESICGAGQCVTIDPIATHTNVVRKTLLEDYILEVTASGDYPTSEFRDALIAAASLSVNTSTTSQTEVWTSCGYYNSGSHCIKHNQIQYSSINYVGLDVYGKDTTANPYLIARISISVILSDNNPSPYACSQTILEYLNVVSVAINPWLYLLAPLTVLCYNVL